jgi:hypothetical protein
MGIINNEQFQLSDLWKFNMKSNEWTLLHGNSSLNLPLVTDGFGLEAANNTPGGRSGGAAFYHEDSRSFRIFGGRSRNIEPMKIHADLWIFYERESPKSNETESTPEITANRAIQSNMIFIVILSSTGALCVILFAAFCIRTMLIHRAFVKNEENLGSYSEDMNNTLGIGYLTETISTPQYSTTPGGATLVAPNEGVEIPAFLEVESADFVFMKKISGGGGGEVYLASPSSEKLKERALIMVAKTTHESSSTFFQEICIMHLFSSSPYIAKLIGYCVNPTTILMKYYQHGALSDYMRKNRESMSLETVLDFALDIGRGISVLQ